MNPQYLGRALMHRRNSADAHRAYVRDGRDLGLLPFWLLSRASPEFGRSFAHAVADLVAMMTSMSPPSSAPRTIRWTCGLSVFSDQSRPSPAACRGGVP